MSYNYPDAHLPTFMDVGFNETLAAVLRGVYVWMALGLLATAGVAAFVSASPISQILAGQPLVFFGLLIAELALVIGLSWGINRITPATAITLFLPTPS